MKIRFRSFLSILFLAFLLLHHEVLGLAAGAERGMLFQIPWEWISFRGANATVRGSKVQGSPYKVN